MLQRSHDFSAKDLTILATKLNQVLFIFKISKNARVPHFKDPGVTTKEQLKLSISGGFEAKMLKSTFNVQAYIPKKLNGKIDELTKAMKNQSEWISINKMHVANKTILKVISL